MALTGTRTYVGFGFGAIQAGLFLYEAFHSGAFRNLSVAEVVPQVVSAVREAGGSYHLNVAHFDHVERATIGPIEIQDPARADDRDRLIQRISEAEEIGTAVPSVECYVSSGRGSIHQILALGLRKKAADGGPRAVIYAAENHNHAAEILRERVRSEIPVGEWRTIDRRVRFLNTVIGKMSGIVSDPERIRRGSLEPIAPCDPRAFLVEAFNRILISRIRFEEERGRPEFSRGITVFEEKEDLLPFEEAKLYGHNATHALAAYLSAVRGVTAIAELKRIPGAMDFLRAAFLQESGGALIQKYSGVDRLFTEDGYREYVDDLLKRMTNPFLGDTVERVGRDPLRKLGWDDRLVGTVRLVLKEGLKPSRYAVGVAAALATLDREYLNDDTMAMERLCEIWSEGSPDPAEIQQVIEWVRSSLEPLRRWKQSASYDLEQLFE